MIMCILYRHCGWIVGQNEEHYEGYDGEDDNQDTSE